MTVEMIEDQISEPTHEVAGTIATNAARHAGLCDDFPAKPLPRSIQPSTYAIGKTAVVVALITAPLALAAYYLYAVNNRYDILKMENGLAYEVDRWTGKTWFLYSDRKELLEDASALEETLETIPDSGKSQIEGHASLQYGSFSGKLYNGSNWTVREVVFLVAAKEPDGSVRWARRLKAAVTIAPLSTERFDVAVAQAEGLGSFTWDVDQARGYCEEQ